MTLYRRRGIDRSFWRGRRVLVTGHTGFKGSWLVLWLDALGAEVTGYSLAPPTTPSLFDQADVAKRLRSISGDVRDVARLADVVAESRPEIVIHMAAQSVVKRGYVDPIETFETNVMGTVNLFEAVRRASAQCAIVNVTSDKCYAPSRTGTALVEGDPMGGDDPYSSSKGCAELVTEAFRHSFFPPSALSEHGVSVATARAGNAIGGGDWTPDQLIPDLVRAFVDDVPCQIRNPHAVRPWQFVLEPLRGYLMLAEHLLSPDAASFCEGWNFGPAATDARPVSWIADELVRHWGGKAAWTHDGRPHPPETSVLRLDATKSATRLGWEPVLPLQGALEWIGDWYRAWRSGEGLEQVTLAQIERYESLPAFEPRSVFA